MYSVSKIRGKPTCDFLDWRCYIHTVVFGLTGLGKQCRPISDSLIRVFTVCNSLCIFWMHYSKKKPSCSTFMVITAKFRVSDILRFLRYIRSLHSHDILYMILCRSGRGAVFSVLVLQSWGRWIDPPLLQSFGWYFKPRSRLHDLVVSGTLNLKLHSTPYLSLYPFYNIDIKHTK